MSFNISSPRNNFVSGCGGVIVGIVLFIASFFLLWFNESNYINSIRMAKFMKKNVVSVETYSAENNRKLIHYIGKIDTNDHIADEYVKVNTPVLERNVEMYQWDEDSYEDSSDVRRYRYEKKWEDRQINSSNFHESGHTNPEMKIQSFTKQVHNATIGEFEVDYSVMNTINPEMDLELKQIPGMKLVDSYTYFTGTNYSNPQIGDYRISYKYVPLKSSVSVISTQANKTLTAFRNSKFTIAQTRLGTHTAEAMIQMFEEESAQTAMIFRIVGFILMFIGTLIIIDPLLSIMTFLPIVGRIGKGILFLLALVLSAALSVITIAIAWVAVRPEIAVPVIVAAAAAIVMAINNKKLAQ